MTMRKDFHGLSVRVACRLCGGKFAARVRRASVCLTCDILERVGSGWTAERIGDMTPYYEDGPVTIVGRCDQERRPAPGRRA